MHKVRVRGACTRHVWGGACARCMWGVHVWGCMHKVCMGGAHARCVWRGANARHTWGVSLQLFSLCGGVSLQLIVEVYRGVTSINQVVQRGVTPINYVGQCQWSHWLWWRPLTYEIHAWRCVEGCASLFVLGYHWLPLATIDLVGDNRIWGLRHILTCYTYYRCLIVQNFKWILCPWLPLVAHSNLWFSGW